MTVALKKIYDAPIQQAAASIRDDLTRVAKGFLAMIRIGVNLQIVRDTMPTVWEEWLSAELDMSETTAKRYLRIAKKFRSVNLQTVSEQVLELLAPRDVSTEVVEEVAERLELAPQTQLEDVEKIIDRARRKKQREREQLEVAEPVAQLEPDIDALTEALQTELAKLEKLCKRFHYVGMPTIVLRSEDDAVMITHDDTELVILSLNEEPVGSRCEGGEI